MNAIYRVSVWRTDHWMSLWAGSSYAYAKQFIRWYEHGYPEDQFRLIVG